MLVGCRYDVTARHPIGSYVPWSSRGSQSQKDMPAADADSPYHEVTSSVAKLCLARGWDTITTGNFRSIAAIKIPRALTGMPRDAIWAEMLKRKAMIAAGSKGKAKEWP
jgi:hypothetical protein